MEYYVNYEIAKKLKEKHFSLNKEEVEFIGRRFIFSDECTIKRISTIAAYDEGYWGENIDCPTISQVLNWLRKEKKLHIEFVSNACGYIYIVSDIPGEGWLNRSFMPFSPRQEKEYQLVKEAYEKLKKQ